MLKGGKQSLSEQKIRALRPVHHQIKQENESVKAYMIWIIVINTISNAILYGIIKMCACGFRYAMKIKREIEILRREGERDRDQPHQEQIKPIATPSRPRPPLEDRKVNAKDPEQHDKTNDV